MKFVCFSLCVVSVLVCLPLQAVDYTQRVSVQLTDKTLAEATRVVMEQLEGGDAVEIVIEPAEFILDIRVTDHELPEEFQGKVGKYISEVCAANRVKMRFTDIAGELALEFLAGATQRTVNISQEKVVFMSIPQKVIVDCFETDDPEQLIADVLKLMQRPGSPVPTKYGGYYTTVGDQLYLIGSMEDWAFMQQAANKTAVGRAKVFLQPRE